MEYTIAPSPEGSPSRRDIGVTARPPSERTRGLSAIGLDRWAADKVRWLFRVIDWMVNLPKPLEVEFCHEINQYEEKTHMPYITTPEHIGREEGLTEGLAKGRAEGRLEGRTEGIEVALELKFGEAGLRLFVPLMVNVSPPSNFRLLPKPPNYIDALPGVYGQAFRALQGRA